MNHYSEIKTFELYQQLPLSAQDKIDAFVEDVWADCVLGDYKDSLTN